MSVEKLLQKLCDHNDKVIAASVVVDDNAIASANGNYEFVDFATIGDYVEQMFDASEMLCDGTDAFASVYVEHDVHGMFAKRMKDDSVLMVVTQPVLGAGLDKLRVAIDIFAKRLDLEIAKGTPVVEVPEPKRAPEPLRVDPDQRIPTAKVVETPEPQEPSDPAAKPKRMYRGVVY